VATLEKTASFKNSLRRSPHWRWLRATEIDAGGHKATKRIDGPDGFHWIRRALRMKRRYEVASGTTAGLYALMLRDTPMFWAHSLWVEEKNPTRWAIEARVLAGESDEQIADKVGTDVDVINAYINVFFDVREKLNNIDYVTQVVMGDAVTRGLQERHYDLLWKMLGYRGGPHVLDAVLHRSPAVTKPGSADDVGVFFQDFAVNTLKYKAALAAVTVQVNTHTQLPLIDAYVKCVEIERNMENATKAQASIVDNIGVMLTSLPFKIGTKLDSAAAKMLPFDNGPAELRGDEMMILASGGKIQDATDIENLHFPGE
jgi:hypothetical protein